MEVTLVLIGFTIPKTFYACLKPSIYVIGHMGPVKFVPHAVVNPSTSRMFGQNQVVVSIKNCSTQPSGYNFLRQLIESCSSY